VGLHAHVGDGLLEKAIALAKKHDTGLHMHVAEDLADQEETLSRYGKRVVERLQQAGALELKTSILSHCIHLSKHEKELMWESGVWVAENVESNQNNNVGLAHYKSITDKVLLGTDGMHSDMLRSAKAAFLAGQVTESIGFGEIYRRFRNVHRYAREFGVRGDTRTICDPQLRFTHGDNLGQLFGSFRVWHRFPSCNDGYLPGQGDRGRGQDDDRS
jgi:hypothetical protein